MTVKNSGGSDDGGNWSEQSIELHFGEIIRLKIFFAFASWIGIILIGKIINYYFYYFN